MIQTLFPEAVVVMEAQHPFEEGTLHPAEAACVERAVPKRRREFAAGRSCARRALGRLGVEGFPLVAGPDRAPAWPPGVVGSITHSGGYCAAAVARRADAAGLGIDAERLRPLEAGVIRRICTPAEWARLRDLAGPERDRLALAIFSAKESTYKCYYPLAGRILEYRDLEVALCLGSGHFTAALAGDGLPAAAGSRRFEGRIGCDDGYVYTAVMLV